jgi:hypothetical protein
VVKDPPFSHRKAAKNYEYKDTYYSGIGMRDARFPGIS